MALSLIRNFSIVAHIDHGKSTLADRLLSLTGTMDAKKAVDQVLDSMDLERERGITIKAHTVRLLYRARDGQEYTLNLIDTPGHVDFSYEVSRALAACEGAVLIVDAAQGIEAQTLANFYLASDANLAIIPVINKIDLPAADAEGTRAQITETLELDGSEALAISAKHGTGVPEVLEAIVARIPPPEGDPDAPLKALVFDSFYDSYQGVVVYMRLTDGRVRPGMRILLMSNGRSYEVQQVGVFSPDMRPVEELSAGQVGYLTASIKRVADAKVGETITETARPTAVAFPGYRDAKPMVFAGLYSIEDTDYEALRDALEKLRLNDPAFTYEPETSLALGYGFRCGFLGMLHMEIVQERLEREFNLSLIVTAPSVQYKILTTAGEVIDIDNPSKMPSPDRIEQMDEPYVKSSVLVPTEFMTAIYKLAQEKRGEHRSLEYHGKRVHIQFDFPLAEIVVDFYDRLKSISKGYASFDYELSEFRPSDLVKLDILLNGDPVDALSIIVHRDKAYEKGKALAEKLRAVIPRQLFEVAIQAAIGSRVIARETVKAMGKNVTAKCYGGDITRKRKLLERQKERRKRFSPCSRPDHGRAKDRDRSESGAHGRRGGAEATPEVDRPRVRRGDRDRGPAGPGHPLARRPGLHHPVRLHDGHAAGRRLHPGQQVPLRARAAARRLAHAGHSRSAARRHHRVQVPAGREARLHQTHRRHGRRARAGPRPSGARQRPAAPGAVHEVRRFRRGARRGSLLRLRVRLRADPGAARLVLRHGRQPRQLPGQSLLGLREAGQDQGPGLPHLLVVGRRSPLAALVAARELY